MAEAAAAIIEEHRKFLVGDEEEILVGIVVEVEKERLGGSVEEIDPGFTAGIGEGAILFGPVEQVGKARGGEDIEIFEPIAVGIADGQAVVPVDADSHRRIEPSPEVVDRGDEDISIGGVGAKDLAGDIDERLCRHPDMLPAADSEGGEFFLPGVPGELRLPVPLVLLLSGGGSCEVEEEVYLGQAVFFGDSDHLELGSLECFKRADALADFPGQGSPLNGWGAEAFFTFGADAG